MKTNKIKKSKLCAESPAKREPREIPTGLRRFAVQLNMRAEYRRELRGLVRSIERLQKRRAILEGRLA